MDEPQYLPSKQRKKFEHFARQDYIAIGKMSGAVHAYVRGILKGDDRILSDLAKKVVEASYTYLKTNPKPRQ